MILGGVACPVRKKAKKQAPEVNVLGPVAVEKTDRISEYKRRKPRLLQKRVSTDEAEPLLSSGWSLRRVLKTGKTVVEKQKAHDEILENRFWCVLYQFGFEELNQGRSFQILVTAGGEAVHKQIDVFGKIDEVIVVAECKSCAKKQTRSLQKDIGEFASLQRPIANALRKRYGADPKLKIVWLFVTGNIIWSSADRARAEEQHIQIIEERELRYFEEIAKSVGPAARYQFLGEFLNEQQIPALSNYAVPAIRTKLGGNWAYYFLAPPARILPISFVNHRGLRDLEGAPAYQRVLKRSRLREIGLYLDAGGFFPNCILVNFRKDVRFENKASFDERQISFGNLYLPDTFKSVWIIDGQHRLFGFTEMAESDAGTQAIPILAFEKLSTISEAELFATINSKQQKVAKGLLDELAGELKLDSDNFSERASAIASRALDMMANETGGPFEDRIKTADLSDSDTVCLTISQVKNAIISAKLLGSVGANEVQVPGPFSRRNTKETLNALCDGLTVYFGKIQAANQDRWDLGRPGYLCGNIAVQGYIRLLQALIEFMTAETGQEAHSLDAEELIEQIDPYLKPILEFVETAEDSEFTKRFKQPFGSGGPPRYFFQLCAIVRTKYPTFKPQGFDDFVSERTAEVAGEADARTKSIVDRVHNHVVNVLRASWGLEHFFHKGIPQKEIKISATAKMYEDKDLPMPVENYLDVIDLKSIIEHKQNWEFFKDTMSIQLPDEKKGHHQYVKWLVRLNEVRRIPAHPYGRSYKEQDLEFLEFIDEQLQARNV
jgi:DNA sulfur modification protein DndB